MPDMTHIVARGVSKRYSGPSGMAVEALSNVDLDVREGEFVCLLGPSGCGKTTLLNIMAGLDVPDSGSVRIGALGKAAPVVRYVFQEARLLPWMTVRENLSFVLDDSRRSKNARIDEWLARVGLGGASDFFPHQLSIGMQQRVSVARGLIVRPDVLLLDEPFGSLDELTAMSMREELLMLWRDIACTVVFVTHNPLEAVLLADRIVVMSASPGRVVHQEHVSDTLPRPRDPDDGRLWRTSRSIVRRLDGAQPSPVE